MRSNPLIFNPHKTQIHFDQDFTRVTITTKKSNHAKKFGKLIFDDGTALVTVGGSQNKQKLVSSIAKLKQLGFKILATEHTAEFFEEKVGQVEIVHKISEPERKPNISDLLYERKIDFIINIPSTSTLEKYVGMLDDEYQIRRKSLELGIPVLTTIELADSFVKTLEWLKDNKTTIEPIEPYDKFE